MTVVCPGCEFENPEGARFCEHARDGVQASLSELVKAAELAMGAVA